MTNYRHCRTLLPLLLAAFVLPGAAAAEKLPNIVVIFCDDLGYGDLGCFGHPTIATPNLDQMAHEGQRWTEFYVAACVCTPSRAALQTGRYPIRNGMCSGQRRVLFPDSKSGLQPSEITIGRMLKDHGYATHCVGKWHLGHLKPHLPTSHGYDSYFGIPYSNDMDAAPAKLTRKQRFWSPQVEYWNVPLMRDMEIVERPANQHTITKRYTEEVQQLIRKNKDQPFFIYLAHNLPHVPLFVSEKFSGASRRGLYGDVVEEIDWSVGQILGTLRELNLAENTLVVFTSDNGPWKSFQDHGGSAGLLRDGKGSTWEGGMREPTIFWWPGKISPRVVSGMGSTLDLMPTFAAISGAKLPADRKLDGYDLGPVLFHGQVSPRNEMFYYHGSELYAVRQGSFKAHYKTKTSYVGQKEAVVHDPPLLFHLGHDPSEQWDVAADHSEVLESIGKLRQQHLDGVEPAEDQLVKR
ncbi:MAG: sulfatase [Planctomycetales bacterium]|nr:sulfatase [Planctomycetales bacterium]